MAQIVRYSGLDTVDAAPLQRAADTILRGRQFNHNRGMQMMEQARRNGDEPLFLKGYKLVHGDDWKDSVDSEAKDLSVGDIDKEAQKSVLSRFMDKEVHLDKGATSAEDWEQQQASWNKFLQSGGQKGDALDSYRDLTAEGEKRLKGLQFDITPQGLRVRKDPSVESLDKKYFEGTPPSDKPDASLTVLPDTPLEKTWETSSPKDRVSTRTNLGDRKQKLTDALYKYRDVQMTPLQKRDAAHAMVDEMYPDARPEEKNALKTFAAGMMDGSVDVKQPAQKKKRVNSSVAKAMNGEMKYWGKHINPNDSIEKKVAYLRNAADARHIDVSDAELTAIANGKGKYTEDSDTAAPAASAPATLTDNQKLLAEEAKKPYLQKLKDDPKAFKRELAKAAPHVVVGKANMKDLDAVYNSVASPTGDDYLRSVFDNSEVEREKDKLTIDFADKIMKYDNKHVSPLNMKRYGDKLRLIQEWEQKAMSRANPNDYARMTMIRDKGNQLREELEQQYGHLFRTYDNRQNPYLDMYKEDQKNRRSSRGGGGKMVYLDIPGQENIVIPESKYRANLDYYNKLQARPTFVGTEQPGDVNRANAKRLQEVRDQLEVTDPKNVERIQKLEKEKEDLEYRTGAQKKLSHRYTKVVKGHKVLMNVWMDGTETPVSIPGPKERTEL